MSDCIKKGDIPTDLLKLDLWQMTSDNKRLVLTCYITYNDITNENIYLNMFNSFGAIGDYS